MSTQPAVTLERVGDWLTGQNLVFEHGEADNLVVGFDNCHVVFCTHDDGNQLVARAYWRGRFEVEQLPELYDMADAHHLRTHGPRLSVLVVEPEEEGGPEQAVLSTQMVEYVAQGRSPEQLAVLMEMIMRMNMSFLADIEERYPALVTWEDD